MNGYLACQTFKIASSKLQIGFPREQFDEVTPCLPWKQNIHQNDISLAAVLLLAATKISCSNKWKVVTEPYLYLHLLMEFTKQQLSASTAACKTSKLKVAPTGDMVPVVPVLGLLSPKFLVT
jgi:hypothetical protein